MIIVLYYIKLLLYISENKRIKGKKNKKAKRIKKQKE